jgi:hypothetical protein
MCVRGGKGQHAHLSVWVDEPDDFFWKALLVRF